MKKSFWIEVSIVQKINNLLKLKKVSKSSIVNKKISTQNKDSYVKKK